MNKNHIQNPNLLNPINDINCVNYAIDANHEIPFFGFAPSETSVRLVSCQYCNHQISAAHIQRHIESVHQQVSENENKVLQLQTCSKLIPSKNCFYSQRESFIFNHLFESEK